MTELERLRGECALLRDALADATENFHDAITQLPQSYVKKFHLAADLERYKGILDESCELSARYAAVVASAEKVGMLNREAPDSLRPMTNGANDAYHALEAAVDALRVARGGSEG